MSQSPQQPRIFKSKRLAIKVGSALLKDRDSGGVRQHWLRSLASDIVALQASGTEVILVTSGAVALGSAALGYDGRPKRQDEARAAAAIGQVALIEAYAKALEPHGVRLAQLLLALDDFEDRARYLTARRAAEALLEKQVIPIINENDPIADLTAGFGDNDRLAARVAQLVGADTLVLLSDVEGLFDADPTKHPNARFIPHVPAITAEIDRIAGPPASGLGSGGMATKIAAARLASGSGITMVICHGTPNHPLNRLLDGARHTVFEAAEKPPSVRKQWLQGLMQPQGQLIVDDGAAAALKAGRSLLAAGIIGVEGQFASGAAVQIVASDTATGGTVLGQGLVGYAATEIRIIRGAKSSDIIDLLGREGPSSVVHADDFVLTMARC